MITVRLLLFLPQLMHSICCSGSQTLPTSGLVGTLPWSLTRPTPPAVHDTHTHIYTHKLPHPSSYSRNTEWIKGKIIHSCKGLQKRRPLVPRLPYSPPHIIPWTPQTIINHAHCITVTLSFIYETPRKSGSHTTSGLLLLLPPAPGSDPLSLCVYVSEWLCVCRGQSQGQCR